MDIGALGKGMAGTVSAKDKHENKDSVECWNCGKRGHYSKDCWRRKDQSNEGGSKGKNKNQTIVVSFVCLCVSMRL